MCWSMYIAINRDILSVKDKVSGINIWLENNAPSNTSRRHSISVTNIHFKINGLHRYRRRPKLITVLITIRQYKKVTVHVINFILNNMCNSKSTGSFHNVPWFKSNAVMTSYKLLLCNTCVTNGITQNVRISYYFCLCNVIYYQRYSVTSYELQFVTKH